MSFPSDKKEEDLKVQKPSLLNSPPVAIFAYCMSSILMTVTNKYVLSVGNFNFNCILLAVQASSVVSFRDFNYAEAKAWLPISVLLVLMIYTASKAMQFLSIPVFTIFKNVTIILIAYGEVIWFGGSVSSMTLFSFFLIVLSSVVAAWSDISIAKSAAAELGEAAADAGFNIGYFWMAANCFSNAGFILCMRKRIKQTKFSDLDTMFYNNLLSIPVLLLGSIIFEDWSAENVLRNFPIDSRNTVFSLMVISGLLSLGISYTSGWCVRVTSSTTYSMVGALNKLPVAVSGLIFFDTPVTFQSVTAIFLGFVSGIVYAVAKVQQQKQREPTLPK
ncbi:hypothetical protein DV451_000538 [Geotrichum candidum]|uniref:GDP-mannose transporter n=1 Tax=Geotrichum candidum TaxID=1173061 RepID=A0A9P5GAZ6_GEOCN|nr:hypothetical protein DV451_000538 [Geotrichum candidum]KAF5111430.1 hypothetical protein DV453_000075 [Geotrichum candidum]